MYYKEFFLSIICISVNVVSNSQSLSPTFIDVDYVGNNNEKQKMDIYIPVGLASPAPVIVFIHGGGWSSGSKGNENIPFFQQSYNSGFICADINYRLSSDSIWPAQIEDCKTAIRYLKANAAFYNIDTCNFGVIGESAGGHLASMLGTSAGVKSLEGLHLGHRNQSSRVKAVVDLYGPTDFLKEDGYYPTSCGSDGMVHNYNSFETKLLGVDFLSSHPVLVSTANPITYISSDDARFFIMHGKDDCVVPFNQSTLLYDALYSANIPADEFILAEGQSHSDPYFSETPQTTLYNKFFLNHLLTPCITSVNDESIFRDVSVYPNPAADNVKIDLQVIDSFTVEVINTNGITVMTVRNHNTIDISGLRSGIYFLKLSSSYDTYTQKLIKH